MKLKILAGTTGRILRVFAQDSSSTTGAGLTGLVFNTASLTAYYSRVGSASAAAVTLVTATAGTWTSGGFVAVDGTNMPGVYELHLPDAAIAASATAVHVMLKGAANLAPVLVEIELDAVNYQSSTAFVASVPAVTGAVGSVTGNVGGNVAGSVGTLGGTVTLAAAQPNYTPATSAAVAALVTTVGAAGAGLTSLPLPTLAQMIAGFGATPLYTGTLTVTDSTHVTFDSAVGSTDLTGTDVVVTAATTGAGQERRILTYNTGTRAAVLDSALTVLPTGTVTYAVYSYPIAPGDTAGTTTLLARLGTPAGASIAADVATRSTYAGGAVASVTATVNATLVPTGLDAIPVTAPTGPATTYRQMGVMTYRRFFRKAGKTPTQMFTYADDGATVITTQALTDDSAGTESQGAAS